MKLLLTIAIPTYNRAAKLKRLLSMLQKEIIAHRLEERVVVMVSDNASKDETPSVALEFSGPFRNLICHRQPENIGFDGNCRFLYGRADTPYVWFMADDDMPLEGALSHIVEAIGALDPDVLLFSFIQPPGSTIRQFDYPEPVRVFEDPAEVIFHVLRYPKVSIFVLRKIEFSDVEQQDLDNNLGGGWYYISLAFSVLESPQNPRLVVISEPLATCDKDFTTIAWVPTPFLNLDMPLQHSFVMKHRSELVKQFPQIISYFSEEGYYNAILCSFAVKCGNLTPECSEEYDAFIKTLDFRAVKLMKRPRSLLQFIALKFHIAGLWPYVRPAVRRVRTLFM